MLQEGLEHNQIMVNQLCNKATPSLRVCSPKLLGKRSKPREITPPLARTFSLAKLASLA